MKVELISHTENADELCAIAGQTCYSADEPGSITPNMNTLKGIIASGHESVLEHAVFTFAVSGVSRALTHQLVRHRMASYSQQSQRYVDVQGAQVVVPQSIQDAIQKAHDDGDEIPYATYKSFVYNLKDLTDTLKALGVPNEDIRYFYPQGIATNIVITMNARELRHFFSLRCCNRAQWEIRQLANAMLALCKDVSPTIFKDAGAGCVRGRCPEGSKSCGRVKE